MGLFSRMALLSGRLGARSTRLLSGYLSIHEPEVRLALNQALPLARLF